MKTPERPIDPPEAEVSPREPSYDDVRQAGVDLNDTLRDIGRYETTGKCPFCGEDVGAMKVANDDVISYCWTCNRDLEEFE